MRFFVFLSLLVITLNSFGQKPVKVGTLDSPNEPSIVINRNNSGEVLCGANLNNLYSSHDGGQTWERTKMSSKYGVWGDPVVISDSSGRYYFFHLSNPPNGSWIDRIVCQTSEDYGVTWSEGTFVGKDGEKAQDKHWAVFNEEKQELYLSWTQFDKYGERDSSCKSNILFSKSNDYGSSWSSPIQINAVSGDCQDSSLTTEGAVPTFSNNGSVYVAWAGTNGIRMNTLTNNSWQNEPKLVDSNTAGWTLSIPGISRCNGMPVTACDRTNGKFAGRLYVNWSDQRNGVENTDVFLKSSDDEALTWSSSKRIGRKSGKGHQFLTWMSLDQTTGALYFIYYDRSRFKDNQTDVVLARSYNGGNSFKYKRIRQQPFAPKANKFFGDYNNIDSHNGIVQMVWTRMEDGDTSVWTARFEESKWKLKRLKKKNQKDSAKDK